MAPTQTCQAHKSATTGRSINESANTVPETDSTVHLMSREPRTRSAIKKTGGRITAGQKQALLDNLQLELTERARKLRSQYIMQAQGLRSRLDLRVNRIPTAMRKRTMGELLQQYMEMDKKTEPVMLHSAQANIVISPFKSLMQVNESHERQVSPTPVSKRRSNYIQEHENIDVPDPKRRVLIDDDAGKMSPIREFSQKVLSPRSANSRTLVRSPIKSSPTKSFLTRPISPLKPVAPGLTGGATTMLHHMVEKAKTSRASAAVSKKASVGTKAVASTTTKRATKAGPTASTRNRVQDRASINSLGSDASSGTVVNAPAKKATLKKSVIGSIKGGIAGVKKAAAAHKSATTTAPTSVTSGRALRKRT